jgi:hypothetical protein
MGIFGQVQGPVSGIIRTLVSDKDLRSVVTYRKFAGKKWDDDSEGQVATFTEYPDLKVIRLSHNSKSVDNFEGVNLQVGDQLYLLDFGDAPAGISLKDEIVSEFGYTQKVKGIQPIFGLALAITVEGGGSGV